MIGRISWVRHAVVVLAIGIITVLTAAGVIGAGDHPEKFDQWQSVVQPVGDDGLRVVDTFDQDFGSTDRHGYEAYFAHDLGAPIDITASSPDAPDALDVTDLRTETRVRIGDPNVTISGQHRYTLAYTYPNAMLGSGVLSLDVLDPDELPIDRFELVVTGMVLGEPECFHGAAGSATACELVESRDGFYRWVVEPLESGAGVTVEGSITEYVEPETVASPPLPDRRTSRQGLLALIVAALGVAGAGGVYAWARRRGRNEVFAGGAADAAYGSLPPPGSAAGPAPPVELVPDSRMHELTTIEFVPPKGIAPWQARVLMDERLGDDAVQAWLSGLAGSGAIEIGESGSNMTIASGPERSSLGADDARLLDAILGLGDPYTTGKYNPSFATAWSAVHQWQRQQIAASGWWKHMAPGGGLRPSTSGSPFGIIMVVVFVLVWSGGMFTAFVGIFQGVVMALLIGLLFPALIAYFVYRALLPARSAPGSALALRTESFRRFLHESEAHHVEWAWEQGLLREYSGWAVALGEADAWSNALARANVPAPARVAAAPIILATRAPSIRAARTAPSSSGSSGGGGGFRGGSVGGGGGGHSRGSW
jgi:uncharacterized membrane protein YgcG